MLLLQQLEPVLLLLLLPDRWQLTVTAIGRLLRLQCLPLSRNLLTPHLILLLALDRVVVVLLHHFLLDPLEADAARQLRVGQFVVGRGHGVLHVEDLVAVVLLVGVDVGRLVPVGVGVILPLVR